MSVGRATNRIGHSGHWKRRVEDWEVSWEGDGGAGILSGGGGEETEGEGEVAVGREGNLGPAEGREGRDIEEEGA